MMELVSWDDYSIPNIWNVIKMFQTTNQAKVGSFSSEVWWEKTWKKRNWDHQILGYGFAKGKTNGTGNIICGIYMWKMNGTSNGLCECNGTWECDGNIMVTNTWISYWDGL